METIFLISLAKYVFGVVLCTPKERGGSLNLHYNISKLVLLEINCIFTLNTSLFGLIMVKMFTNVNISIWF